MNSQQLTAMVSLVHLQGPGVEPSDETLIWDYFLSLISPLESGFFGREFAATWIPEVARIAREIEPVLGSNPENFPSWEVLGWFIAREVKRHDSLREHADDYLKWVAWRERLEKGETHV